MDASNNWTHVVVRATVGRNGARPRFYCLWIEDIEGISRSLHQAMYSHLVGDGGNLLPEDARMGYDMRATSYVVDADSRHRFASVAAEIQPLCLVASCKGNFTLLICYL